MSAAPLPSSPSAILDAITTHKREELVHWKSLYPMEYWLERASIREGEAAFRFERALREPRTPEAAHLICELKPKSPSAGVLQAQPNVPAIIQSYNEVATCISVLVDEHFFGGSLNLFAQVRQLTDKPLLFKEFVLDLYQVLQAVDAGADAVLLIMKCLDDVQYVQLFEAIKSYGLTPVVEIQNEAEWVRAQMVHPSVVLINNRNLDTFAIEMDTTHRLAPLIPPETLVISASGFEALENARAIYPTAHAALIGTALMRS
jgi:indole-3-glycerol phosphate synthase / phosphoribosylanthranilate isomerase